MRTPPPSLAANATDAAGVLQGHHQVRAAAATTAHTVVTTATSDHHLLALAPATSPRPPQQPPPRPRHGHVTTSSPPCPRPRHHDDHLPALAMATSHNVTARLAAGADSSPSPRFADFKKNSFYFTSERCSIQAAIMLKRYFLIFNFNSLFFANPESLSPLRVPTRQQFSSSNIRAAAAVALVQIKIKH